MSRAKLDGVFDEATSVVRIRSALVDIQLALDKGPKRTVARRAQAWAEITEEAGKRVAALGIAAKGPEVANELDALRPPSQQGEVAA